MKIGILSDTHLGYAWDTVREDDSFIQAHEGLQRLLDAGADAIVHCGDIFDSPIPRPEVMARAMDIFSECNAREPSVRLTSFFNREPPRNPQKGVPLLAIHGNHERRPKGMTNPVQVLEKAGLLVYLHSSGVGLNNEVGVFGLGNIPERYALPVFQKFEMKSSFQKNLLLIHQTVKEVFSAPNEPSTLGLSDMPAGFTTICGHIHWSLQKPDFILPGGTIRTQMGQAEPDEKKVYLFDTKTDILEPIILKTTRPFFYETVQVAGKTPDQILLECEALASKLETDPRAMMKIKLTGKLGPGFESRNIKVEPLIRKYQLLSIDRDFEGEQFLPSLPQGVRLDEMLAKAIEMAMEKRGLKMDARLLINHLLSGDTDAVLEALSNDPKD